MGKAEEGPIGSGVHILHAPVAATTKIPALTMSGAPVVATHGGSWRIQKLAISAMSSYMTVRLA